MLFLVGCYAETRPAHGRSQRVSMRWPPASLFLAGDFLLYIAEVESDVLPDHREERLSVALQLGLPHSADSQQFVLVSRAPVDDLHERRIVEYDVGRHLVFGREQLAAAAERLPELPVRFCDGGLHGARFPRRRGQAQIASQHDGRLTAQQGTAFLLKRKRPETLRVRAQVTLP